MKKTTSILIFMMISMLIVSACVQQQPDQAGQVPPEANPAVTAISSGSTGEVTPAPPTSLPVEPTAGGQIIVTLDDQGKTIYLTVGEDFLLKLGDEYTWEVNISDQNVLNRVKNIMVVRGAQGVYNAGQAGKVTLSATGDPQCRQSQPPCGMPSILFQITVIVK
jgi:hypothetical protein